MPKRLSSTRLAAGTAGNTTGAKRRSNHALRLAGARLPLVQFPVSAVVPFIATTKGGVVSVILNRRETATVIAGLRLLAGDGVRVPNYPHVLVAGMCDETEPEYDLRFEADEEHVRELIDRIDRMSLREAEKGAVDTSTGRVRSSAGLQAVWINNENRLQLHIVGREWHCVGDLVMCT